MKARGRDALGTTDLSNHPAAPSKTPTPEEHPKEIRLKAYATSRLADGYCRETANIEIHYKEMIDRIVYWDRSITTRKELWNRALQLLEANTPAAHKQPIPEA